MSRMLAGRIQFRRWLWRKMRWRLWGTSKCLCMRPFRTEFLTRPISVGTSPRMCLGKLSLGARYPLLRQNFSALQSALSLDQGISQAAWTRTSCELAQQGRCDSLKLWYCGTRSRSSNHWFCPQSRCIVLVCTFCRRTSWRKWGMFYMLFRSDGVFAFR